jgi:hypothetical protein
MNTEDQWKAWWELEGRNAQRLPHHDAVDHLASMTRIAWLNGAFYAADEIERLRAERDEVRQSYCSLMEAYRGGDGRVTANKLGWGYLFEEDTPCSVTPAP